MDVIIFSNKWWETKSEIYIVPAISTISHLTAFRKYKHQEKSWCTRPWEAVLKWTMSAKAKQGQYKHRKVSTIVNWILQRKSISNRWTRFKRRGQNLQHRRGWRIWCLTSNKVEVTNMQWLTIHLQKLFNQPMLINLEVHRVNHRHRPRR